jgi:hypothetical protein
MNSQIQALSFEEVMGIVKLGASHQCPECKRFMYDKLDWEVIKTYKMCVDCYKDYEKRKEDRV